MHFNKAERRHFNNFERIEMFGMNASPVILFSDSATGERIHFIPDFSRGRPEGTFWAKDIKGEEQNFNCLEMAIMFIEGKI